MSNSADKLPNRGEQAVGCLTALAGGFAGTLIGYIGALVLAPPICRLLDIRGLEVAIVVMALSVAGGICGVIGVS